MHSKNLKIPGVGRIGLIHERSGQGVGILGSSRPSGALQAVVMRGGRPVLAREVMPFWSRFWGNIRGDATQIDLGSGLVTNVGVLDMANEYAWANPSGSVNTILGLANAHASGTGTTAAAATDFKLQTWDSVAAVSGVQSLISAANAQAYRTVATISYAGSEAVTEWGLHTSTTLSTTTGTPFTATSATGGTATGTPFTASSATLAGLQHQIIIPATTAVWGLILVNTTSGVTIPAWYKQTDGTAGSTPGATEAYTLRPVMWDHKVFAAINVVSGDSIQFTYTVTVNSGG